MQTLSPAFLFLAVAASCRQSEGGRDSGPACPTSLPNSRRECLLRANELRSPATIAMAQATCRELFLEDGDAPPTGRFFYVNGFQECLPIDFDQNGKMLALPLEGCTVPRCSGRTTNFCSAMGLFERLPNEELALTCDNVSRMAAASKDATVYKAHRVSDGIDLRATDHQFRLFRHLASCAGSLHEPALDGFRDKVDAAVKEWNRLTLENCRRKKGGLCLPMSDNDLMDSLFNTPLAVIADRWGVAFETSTAFAAPHHPPPRPYTAP
jgi:hypothetical protein